MRNTASLRRLSGLVPLALALAVLGVHAWILSGWIVDDAGITFAYARNLASGHGLVSQPGQPAVEGFSNPLWTLLVAILYAAGVFDVSIVPKLLGVALASGVLVLIWQDLRRRVRSQAVLTIPLLLIATCSPFVIWTTSGLENALLALLVILSARLSLDALTAGDQRGHAMTAGVVAALAALTRPDAILYAVIYPAAVLLAEARLGWRAVPRLWRRWLWFGAGITPVYAGYLIFRVRYFDDVVPNTFYAKQKPSLGAVDAGKLLDLVESASGDFFPLIFVFVAACVVALLVTRRLSARTTVLSAYLAAAAAVFLVMPPDWMGEYRFATPFFPLFFWGLTELAVALAPAVTRSWVIRGFQAAVIVFALQAMVIFWARTIAFADQPTVPLREVRAYAGDGFNRLAETLGAEHMSVLTPDLGGALLDSTMRVYDLAGLCDRRIARALSSNNTRDIHEYVFGELKPTFIHTHGAFTRATRLNDDPRFARDYVALNEHADGPAAWRQMWDGVPAPAWSGDYVRQDVLGRDDQRLDALKAVYRRHQLARFVPWVRPPDRLQQGWPQVMWATDTISAHLRTTRLLSIDPESP